MSTVGEMIFDTKSNQIFVFDGSDWQPATATEIDKRLQIAEKILQEFPEAFELYEKELIIKKLKGD